jgi:glucosamine--fructose-6-phosphate aminotransferase (isomerizing)
MSRMEAELGMTPELVAALTAPDRVRSQLRDQGLRPFRHLVLTGCGSSYFAAHLAAIQLRAKGFPVGLEDSGDLLTEAVTLSSEDLLVVLTQSGETKTVLELMRRRRRQGDQQVVITGHPESEAASLADVVVDSGFFGDESLCHTASVMVSGLLALEVVASSDRRRGTSGRVLQPDRARLSASLKALFARRSEIGAWIDWTAVTHALLLASDRTWPVAEEGSLKLAEATYLPALAVRFETFFHGYIPLTNPNTAVVALLTSKADARRAAEFELVRRTVGFQGKAVDQKTLGLGSDSEEDVLFPWLALYAMHLITLGAAGQRRTNPDLLRREDPKYLSARQMHR